MSRRKIDPQDQKRILQSKDTALVVVTAYLPAMVRKGQQFDVTVAVPPNSDAKSLKGGWLLETRLFEEQNVEGRGSMKGREYGVAYGAILTAPGAEKDPTRVTAEMRRGMIPGGALSSTERDLQIVLMNNKRGFRNSKRIATAISERFNHYNRFGQRIPLAEAKTDAMMTLKVHPSYRNNFPRYQQVIRNIAFNETEVARRLRMEQLEKDIVKPAGARNCRHPVPAASTGIQRLRSAISCRSGPRIPR
jgi:flagellar basal body P-ring protein FlgI